MSRLTRYAAQLSKGLRGHLAEGGVPDLVMRFLENRRNRIPDKMAKWLAFKLRDHLRMKFGDELHMVTPERIAEELEALQDDVAYIRDYYTGTQGVDLFQFDTIEKAHEAAEEWHRQIAEEMRDQGHPDLYEYPDHQAFPLGDGFKMVKINPDDPDNDLENEGKLMGHCVGSGDYHKPTRDKEIEIWSLRDSGGYPHATIELGQSDDDFPYEVEDFLLDFDDDYDAAEQEYYEERRAWEPDGSRPIEQIQGKENHPPIDRYRPYLHRWVTETTERGEVAAGPDDLLRVTPSAQLIEMIAEDPENAKRYMDHLDEDFNQYLSRFMNDPDILSKMPLDAVDKIIRISGEEPPSELIDELRASTANIENLGYRPGGWSSFSGARTLLRNYPGTKITPRQFAAALTQNPNAPLRLHGYEHLLMLDGLDHRASTPEGMEPWQFLSTDEGAELASQFLLNEPDPSAVHSLMRNVTQQSSMTGAEIHPKLPQTALELLARSAKEEEEKESWGPNWRSWADAEALKMIRQKAPELLPQAISTVSSRNLMDDSRNKELAWAIVHAFKEMEGNPEIFPQMVENMSPQLIELMRLPNEPRPQNLHGRGFYFSPVVDMHFKQLEDQGEWPMEVPTEEPNDIQDDLATTAARLDRRGQYDLADRLDALTRIDAK